MPIGIGRVHIPNAGTSEGTRTWNYGRLADGGRGARFILMGHGVHDVVEDDAESKSGKLLGVLRAVRPFPGVAEMHVGADGHHDAPVIVADGAPLGHVAVLFISAAGVDVDLAGDLTFHRCRISSGIFRRRRGDPPPAGPAAPCAYRP